MACLGYPSLIRSNDKLAQKWLAQAEFEKKRTEVAKREKSDNPWKEKEKAIILKIFIAAFS